MDEYEPSSNHRGVRTDGADEIEEVIYKVHLPSYWTQSIKFAIVHDFDLGL